MSSCSPQHLAYSELTRNIDSTLSLFCRDRNRIIEDLSKDPVDLVKRLWTYESPIGIDRGCMCQMGIPFPKTIQERVENNSDINNIMRRMYRCAGCNVMRRLYDIEKKEPGTIFSIECGRYQGKNFVVESMPITILSLDVTSAPQRYLDLILREKTNMVKCEPKLPSLKKATFMGSDPFTNRLLVTWYVDYILSQKGLSNINRIHTAFVCNNDGYMLSEVPDVGSLNEFSTYTPFSRIIEKPSVESTSYIRTEEGPIVVMTSDTVINILKQLLSTLRILQMCDFSYGGVDSDSLTFYAERSSYRYDGINVNCDFTLKLNDLRNSGITIKSDFLLRLYSRSELTESQIDSVPFKPMVTTASLQDDIVKTSTICPSNYCDTNKRYYVYKIDSKYHGPKFESLFLYMQHLGIPLYQSSFDIYSFMVLLMSNSAFYGGVSENSTLFEIWKSMWLPSEFSDVNVSIREFHSIDILDKVDIVMFLSKYQLRCDVSNLLWETIKSLP